MMVDVWRGGATGRQGRELAI